MDILEEEPMMANPNDSAVDACSINNIENGNSLNQNIQRRNTDLNQALPSDSAQSVGGILAQENRITNHQNTQERISGEPNRNFSHQISSQMNQQPRNQISHHPNAQEVNPQLMQQMNAMGQVNMNQWANGQMDPASMAQWWSSNGGAGSSNMPYWWNGGGNSGGGGMPPPIL